jgi:hypothetical protein
MRDLPFIGHPRLRGLAGVFAVAALAAAAPLHALRAQGGVGSTTDPRVGLKAGLQDAGTAIENLNLVAHVDKPSAFVPTTADPRDARGLNFANSDMAFQGHWAVQGNFSGFQIWDISNPHSPKLRTAYLCATDQGDPSLWGNLLFISAEATRNRLDCGMGGVQDTVSKDRMRGVRIFDISDIDHPKQVADIQTCRGSHTHTLVPDLHDKSIVYVYVSGSAGVRSPNELAGCSTGTQAENAATAWYRIEVIKVPVAHPDESKIVSSPRIFDSLTAPPVHGNPAGDTAAAAAAAARGRGGRGGGAGRGNFAARGPQPPRDLGPNQCHDITVYPAIGLAGGACAGYGLLLDIRDPAHPKRIQAVADSNFSFWHSATFNNAGTSLIFTDEWGGGTQPKCRSIDPLDWGGDALFRLSHDRLTQASYFKMPAVQTSQENCVAHNGGLIPVPGRDIMAQGWYQGGIDVYDFTDVSHPVEIAYFDRGPIDATKMVTGGFWAAYWYNGYIYGSEIARGLDIFELKPSKYLTQNEIDAAKLVHMDRYNPQLQPKLVWPAAFPVVRSYLDQLVRDNGLPEARTSAIAAAVDAAQKESGAARRASLDKLAASLDGDVSKASDTHRVRLMASAVRDLAKATK